MYIIKQIPEDFFVKEISKYELSEDGAYLYFILKKRNYNTIDAVAEIARRLRIPLKKIGFAGTKDKVAVTEQAISINGLDKDTVQKTHIKDIELEFIGKGKNPISLGDLKGNEFIIVVRNLIRNKIFFNKTQKITNLFGEQRFSENNAEIGKALVQKNFVKAASLINQTSVKEHIEIYPADFIGAIRMLPIKLRKMYINAYQSLIWNKTVEEYLKKVKPIKNEKIPIVGFGTELKDSLLSRIIHNIMNKEGISQRDFIVKEFPEISSEGGERDLYVTPENIYVSSIQEDELNPGKYKATVAFSLPAGSYATVVVKELFNSC